jgi:hypothetical protein
MCDLDLDLRKLNFCVTLSLTMVNIYSTWYWNPSMHIKVLLWTCVFQWPLSVTLTFDLQTWFMSKTQIHIMVNISIKFYYNPSMHVGDMVPIKSWHVCSSVQQRRSNNKTVFQMKLIDKIFDKFIFKSFTVLVYI